jgi:hypothetical protein
MSYYYSPLGAFDKEQRESLAVTPEELAQLDPQTRGDFLLRYAELKAQKRSDFWSAVESIAAGALPILAFLGVTHLWGKKR